MNDRIIELKREGWPNWQIAEEVGTSRTTVTRICKAAGLMRENGFAAPRGPDTQPSRKGRDLWPDIPEHIRITERGK